MDEGGALDGQRMHQVGKVLALDGTDIFESGDGVIAQRERPALDTGKPAAKARERERVLLAGVHDDGGFRRVELSASALGHDGQRRRRHGRDGQLPFERRGDERAAFLH